MCYLFAIVLYQCYSGPVIDNALTVSVAVSRLKLNFGQIFLTIKIELRWSYKIQSH